MTTQVVIAGAGPTGLMLAAELGLAGIEAIVLEALPAPTGESRALGVNPRAVELWEQRGITGRFHDGRMISRIHYGALPEFMDLNRLDSPFGVMMIPQRRVEEVLGEWATELGADIRRGHPVTGVRQSDSAVQVTVSGPDGDYELQAQYWSVVTDRGAWSVAPPASTSLAPHRQWTPSWSTSRVSAWNSNSSGVTTGGCGRSFRSVRTCSGWSSTSSIGHRGGTPPRRTSPRSARWRTGSPGSTCGRAPRAG